MSETDIQKRLDKFVRQQGEILSLLHQFVQPAAHVSVQKKAEATLRALRSGDRQQLKQTLREINGQ